MSVAGECTPAGKSCGKPCVKCNPGGLSRLNEKTKRAAQ